MTDRPPYDENATLLMEGVMTLPPLLAPESFGDKDKRAEAMAGWAEFEAKLRANPRRSVPLSLLADRFQLSSFELQTLTLALSVHIEPGMTKFLSKLAGPLNTRRVTARVAIQCFCGEIPEKMAARRAFLPSAPLRRHLLVRFGKADAGAVAGIMDRALEITTPTLRYLLREDELTESVARIANLEHPEVNILNVILPDDQVRQVQELVDHHTRYRQAISEWGFDKVLPYGRGLTLLFSGPSGTGKTLLAKSLAAHTGRPLLSVNAADLPDKEGVDAALRELFAEGTLREALVLIDEAEALYARGDRRKATAFNELEAFEGVCILTTNHPEQLDEALERRIIYHLPFEVPDATLRTQIWEVHLPPDVPLGRDIDLNILANRYDFTGGTIKNAILVAVNRALARNPKDPRLTMELLDGGCRSQLRYALEELTVRTTTHLRLKDIVLPDEPMKKVREILSAIRNQAVVLNRWGFGRKLVTGKGITILFDGPPGTGKTLAAEIIAGEFDRPLYRVNLPEIVSKWVGETEKHIKALFQQARVSHAMLLFDEADALFGARTAETRTATDRYANMEVNLLLQEIERFPGVCILTTNFFGSLDRALVRRIQFRVTFEEPDVEQRRKIWETLRPPEAPIGADVDWHKVAERYEMTGGMIKNALLRAAYAACDAGTEITHGVIADACRDEYKAAGKLARDPDYVAPPRPIVREVERGTETPAFGSQAPSAPKDHPGGGPPPRRR